MHGVTFGNQHSFRAWGLMLKDKPVISPPQPKYKIVQVTGTDKIIDLTESLTGKVHYEPRTISMEFVLMRDRNRWAAIYSDILNTLHGKRVRIIFDDDPNFYYVGRVTVGEFDGEAAHASLPITAEVEPYKREKYGEGRWL